MSADILGPYHAQHIVQVMDVSKSKYTCTLYTTDIILHGSITPQKVLEVYHAEHNLEHNLETLCQKYSREYVRCFLNARGMVIRKSRVCTSKCDGQLHEFRTFGIDENKRKMVINLQDTGLLTKISDGALTATEAKHLSCLTALRNWYHSFIRQNQTCMHVNQYKSQINTDQYLISQINITQINITLVIHLLSQTRLYMLIHEYTAIV